MDRELAEHRIRAAMATSCTREVQWGVDDCTFWCADILAPLLGVDLVAEARGKFRSQSGAYRFMGAGGLRKWLNKTAITRGWAWVPPDRAQVGDVGIAMAARRTVRRWLVINGKKVKSAVEVPAASTVICIAPGWFVARGELGFATIPASRVQQAWAVK